MNAIEASANWRKGIAAVLAAAGVIIASGLLDDEAQLWASTIVSAIGAALVILLPNGDAESEEAAG